MLTRIAASLLFLGVAAAHAAEKDLYRDVVAPLLDDRCTDCHGAAKQKSGLRLDSYASIMKGRKEGAVIVPGNAKHSDLYRAITLPRGNEDHMPPPKRTQLEPAEIDAIRIWIDKGAPEQLPVHQAGTLPSAVQKLFSAPAPSPHHTPAAGTSAQGAHHPEAGVHPAAHAGRAAHEDDDDEHEHEK